MEALEARLRDMYHGGFARMDPRETQAVAEAMLRLAKSPEQLVELGRHLHNYSYGYHRAGIVAAAAAAHFDDRVAGVRHPRKGRKRSRFVAPADVMAEAARRASAA